MIGTILRYGVLGVSAAALTAAVTASATAATAQSVSQQPYKDAVGDVVDENGEKVTAPYGDIALIEGVITRSELTLTYKTAQSQSPLKDKNWASKDSHAKFTIDTNQDDDPDFSAVYAVNKDGKLATAVYDATDDSDDAEPICSGKALYAKGLHTLVLDLSCLKNPRNLTFRLSTSYHLNAGGENSVVGYDDAPGTRFLSI
ncbi:hypothetical protein GCM10010123_32400 [Pilimelia anulata]|uniref:Uncharacterized protein n=1 Tax=Pilimelia anulata TaxID=53371 RepID=A0A8J3FA94_9ACTN|nr:hypothetical protein [Pilimelia anulata]GGK00071.1 hypothetical protein GCM10010123_32400 [Pilimelia anulata]